jgi:hypothetical protein
MKPNANWNTLNDKLNAAGLRGREQSPEFAARRFMIDLERPAIISADARIALSSGNEDFKLMLNNNFFGRQIALEAHAAGSTKHASHRTADLRRNANRVAAIAIINQDRFDLQAIA